MSAAAAMPIMHMLAGHARRLTLPLLATSATIGASMFVGDVACQALQHSTARSTLLAQHAADTARALASGKPLPAPLNLDESLSYRPAPDSPPARLPNIPASLLDRAPTWWNPARSGAMLATGFLASGPWSFAIVRASEHFFPGRGARAITAKMACSIGQAPLGISSTFYVNNWFAGRSSEEGVAKVKNEMPSTFATGTLYWPIVSFFNLRYIEVAFRPVIGAMAGSVWNIYISSQASKPLKACVAEPNSDGHALPTTLQPATAAAAAAAAAAVNLKVAPLPASAATTPQS